MAPRRTLRTGSAAQEVGRNRTTLSEQKQSQSGDEQFRLLAEARRSSSGWPVRTPCAPTQSRLARNARAQASEEIGNGWTEGLHPDDRDLCLETYLKSFSARQPFRPVLPRAARRRRICVGGIDGCAVTSTADSTFLG